MRSCLCSVVLLLSLIQAQAAPTIKVRGRAEIELDPVSRSFESVAISGELRDRYAEAPIPWDTVRVRIGLQEQRATTDAQGRFYTTFDVSDGTYDISVTYEGSSKFSAATVNLQGVNVAKEALKLEILIDPIVDHGESVFARITAAGADQKTPATVVVKATIAEVKTPDKTRDLGEELEVSEGKLRLEITPEKLGPPGDKVLTVTFAGNAAYNGAKDDVSFTARAATTVAFKLLSPREMAFEGTLLGGGTLLLKSTNKPVPNGAMVLLAGRRRVDQTVTDDQGRFSFNVPGSELQPGEYQLQAVFEPSGGTLNPSRSSPIPVKVGAPQPTSALPSALVFGGAVVLVLVVLFLGRRKNKVDPSDEQVRREQEENATRGLSTSKRRLSGTLRRANVREISGRVLTLPRERPPRGFVVKFSHGLQVEGKAEGQFASGSLEPGEYEITVEAAECLPETFTVRIPHRGELSDATVHVLPIREAIFRAYHAYIAPSLPDDKTHIMTPRQVLDFMQKVRQTPKLATLTQFVEDAYFSDKRLSRADHETVLSLITAATHEAAPQAPTAGLSAPRDAP